MPAAVYEGSFEFVAQVRSKRKARPPADKPPSGIKGLKLTDGSGTS